MPEPRVHVLDDPARIALEAEIAGGDLVLLRPPGGEVHEPGLRRAIERMRGDERPAAVVDLPQGAPDLLALVLEPRSVGAVLARAATARACGVPLLSATTLAPAEAALCLARSFEIQRSESPIAPAAADESAAPGEVSAFGARALAHLAIEDLYPELRTPAGNDARYPSLIHCAGELLQRGRSAEGFALGAYAERLLSGCDAGVGLGLPIAVEGEPGDPPEVSVIIPTLDRPVFLDRALRSLSEQSSRSFEVIVINDGGRDPSSVLERSAIPGVRVTLIHHARSRGPAAARNVGLRLARGRWIQLLDDDDRLLPGHLAALLPPLRLGARVVHSDTRSVLETGHPLPTTRKLGILYASGYDPRLFKLDNQLPIQSVLCERDLLLEVGGFDERLQVLEDWDLWLRVFEQAPPVHVRRITSEVRSRQDGASNTEQNRHGWLEVTGHIYGKTLRFERGDPGLRELRLREIQGRCQSWSAPFPVGARVWLQGDGELPAIDPGDLARFGGGRSCSVQ